MKQTILSTLLIIGTICAYAQDKTTLLFNFSFHISNELTTIEKSQNTKYKLLNLATVEEMPKSFSDSVLAVAEDYLERKYGGKSESKRVKEATVMGAPPQHLRYLPAFTFKKGLKHGTYDYYVKLQCSITPGGKKNFGPKKWKVKPMVTMYVFVFDKDKNKIWKNRVVLNDFAELRTTSYKKVYGHRWLGENTYIESEYETLTAQDVFNMYVLGMAELFKEE